MSKTTTNWREWFQQNVSQSGDSLESAHYDSPRSFYIRQQVVMDWLGSIRGKTVVDIGVATGHFSAPLADGNQVIGIDFVADMLRHAANKAIAPLQADGMQLPLANHSADVVICVGVLQHIDDTDAFLGELLRIRKPDGHIYLVTLNKDSLIRKAYYALPQHTETMHTYSMPGLIAQFQRLAPGTPVEAAAIYYPFPGYRRVGAKPWLSRYLATVLAIRVG